jgi:hypothetical protein
LEKIKHTRFSMFFFFFLPSYNDKTYYDLSIRRRKKYIIPATSG